jgi:hypothetical protein
MPIKSLDKIATLFIVGVSETTGEGWPDIGRFSPFLIKIT